MARGTRLTPPTNDPTPHKRNCHFCKNPQGFKPTISSYQRGNLAYCNMAYFWENGDTLHPGFVEFRLVFFLDAVVCWLAGWPDHTGSSFHIRWHRTIKSDEKKMEMDAINVVGRRALGRGQLTVEHVDHLCTQPAPGGVAVRNLGARGLWVGKRCMDGDIGGHSRCFVSFFRGHKTCTCTNCTPNTPAHTCVCCTAQNVRVQASLQEQQRHQTVGLGT